jgi:hypothetical protein
MYNKDGLVEKFKKAGLVLKFGTVMGSNTVRDNKAP